MWEFFQKVLKDNITPNQLMLLYAFDKSLGVPQINSHLELRGLLAAKYMVKDDDGYKITPTGKIKMRKYNNIFIKAKKKTNIGVMGNEYADKVVIYRELFPKQKLPTGKPARQNIKTLTDGFRWFFENYDYTWDEVLAATRKYLNQYEDTGYMYMKNSQYFIVKTMRTQEKVSELADYCDIIREGTDDDIPHFKDNVV